MQNKKQISAKKAENLHNDDTKRALFAIFNTASKASAAPSRH